MKAREAWFLKGKVRESDLFVLALGYHGWDRCLCVYDILRERFSGGTWVDITVCISGGAIPSLV